MVSRPGWWAQVIFVPKPVPACLGLELSPVWVSYPRISCHWRRRPSISLDWRKWDVIVVRGLLAQT